MLNHLLTLPRALVAFFFDSVVSLTLVASFVAVSVALVSRGDEPLALASWVQLGAVAVCSVYQLGQEGKQAMTMHKIGLLQSYLTDGSNQLEVVTAATSLAIAGTAILGGGEVRSAPAFRVFVTLSVCLVWLNLLNFMRVLHRKFAAFIGALVQTLVDLQWFLVVLGVFFLMFCNSFLTLLSSAVDDNDAGGGDGSPFRVRRLERHNDAGGAPGHHGEYDALQSGTLSSGSIVADLITLWRIMLGDIEMVWLQSSDVEVWTQALFLLYTFVVVIILLNMLIAVVSDSYEHAMMESHNIFLRNRLERAAAISGSNNSVASPFLVERVLRPLLKPLLAAEAALSDDTSGADDVWVCRALEQEKRTRAVVMEQGKTLAAKVDATESKVESKVDAIREAMESKVDAVEGKVDAIREAMEIKVDALREAMESKVDAIRNTMESKVDAIREAMDQKQDEMKTLNATLVQLLDSIPIATNVRVAQ